MGQRIAEDRSVPSIRGRACVIGIDPGLGGGICAVGTKDKQIFSVYAMPVTRISRGRDSWRVMDIPMLLNVFRWYREAYHVEGVLLEDVHSSPQMGVVSAFSFGHTTGLIEGVVSAIFPGMLQKISPAKWKTKYGIGRDKGRAIEKARELFTAGSLMKNHDGMAEAALIARYGIENCLNEFDCNPLED